MSQPATLTRPPEQAEKHADKHADCIVPDAQDAQFIKQWVHERTTADERSGRSLVLCLTASVVAGVLTASVYGFRSLVAAGTNRSQVTAVSGPADSSLVLNSVHSPVVPPAVSQGHARGRQAAQEGRMAEAVALFKQAEQACRSNHPLRAQLLNELGAALIVEHKESEAVPYLQEALRLDASLTAARHNLSLCTSK